MKNFRAKDVLMFTVSTEDKTRRTGTVAPLLGSRSDVTLHFGGTDVNKNRRSNKKITSLFFKVG